MFQIKLGVIRNKEWFEVSCPKCNKKLYAGDWQVTLDINGFHYFVGEFLQCCVLVRCQAAFPSQDGAQARLETVHGIISHSQSLESIELFQIVQNSKVLTYVN